MKFTSVAIVAGAALASAQDCPEWACAPQLEALPECGIAPVQKHAATLGCGPTDYACRCEKSAQISQLAMNDVIAACGDIFKALEFSEKAANLCTCVSANGEPEPCGVTTSDIPLPPSSTVAPPPPSSTVVPPAPGPTCGTDDWSCQPLWENVPECGIQCFIDAAAQFCNGDGNDLACRCEQQVAIRPKAALCAIRSCGSSQAGIAFFNAHIEFCNCVNSEGAPAPCSSSSAIPSSSTVIPSSSVESSSTVEPSTTVESSSTVEPSTTVEPSSSTTECPLITTTAEWGCAPSVSAVPSCGAPCIVSAAGVVGCSDPTDYDCRCGKAAEIQPIAMNCVIEGCGDLFKALEVAESAASLCACVTESGGPSTITTSPTDCTATPTDVSSTPSVTPSNSGSGSPSPTGGSPSTTLETKTKTATVTEDCETTTFVTKITTTITTTRCTCSDDNGDETVTLTTSCPGGNGDDVTTVTKTTDTTVTSTWTKTKEDEEPTAYPTGPHEDDDEEEDDVPAPGDDEEDDEEDDVPAPPADDDEEDDTPSPPPVDVPTESEPVIPPVVTAGADKLMLVAGSAFTAALIAAMAAL